MKYTWNKNNFDKNKIYMNISIITEEEAMQINECIVNHMKEIVSFDLVEFNPLRDQDRKTEQIAINILAQIIQAAEDKKKWEAKQFYY